MKSVIRMRMSAHDAHYGGNLVDGAKMLQLSATLLRSFLSSTMEMKVCFALMITWSFLRPCLQEITLKRQARS